MLSSKGQPNLTGSGANLLRRIEALDEEMSVVSSTGSSRWMVPYADFVTVLLGLFMVLFALNPAGATLESIPGATSQFSASNLTEGELLSEAQAPRVVKEQLEPGTEPLKEATEPEEIVHMLALLNENPGDLPPDVLENLQENLSVHQSSEGTVISLKDSILFSPGNAELGVQAEQTLDHLVETLLQTEGYTDHAIRIEGHTDNTPIATSQYPSNWELSTARATAIVRYLSDRHGMPPDRLSAVGYGEFHPVAENSSIEGKRKNRRVDIVILGASGVPEDSNRDFSKS